MTLALVDRFATEAKGRAKLYLSALRGLLAETVANPEFQQPASRQRFESQAHELLLSHLAGERDKLRRDTVEVALRAVSDAQAAVGASRVILNDDEHALLMEHIYGAAFHVTGLSRDQARRDLDAVRAELRSMALRVEMVMNQRGWKRNAARIAVQERQKNSLSFRFVDRAGKRWDSTKYVHTLVRGHLISVYNDAYLYTLSRFGISTAVVTHVDQKHKHHGLRFVFAGEEPGLPRYDEIRDQVFHPNANALVALQE